MAVTNTPHNESDIPQPTGISGAEVIEFTAPNDNDSDHKKRMKRVGAGLVVLTVGAIGFLVGNSGKGDSETQATNPDQPPVATSPQTIEEFTPDLTGDLPPVTETTIVVETTTIPNDSENLNLEPRPLTGSTPQELTDQYAFNARQAYLTGDFSFFEVMGIPYDLSNPGIDQLVGHVNLISGDLFVDPTLTTVNADNNKDAVIDGNSVSITFEETISGYYYRTGNVEYAIYEKRVDLMRVSKDSSWLIINDVPEVIVSEIPDIRTVLEPIQD